MQGVFAFLLESEQWNKENLKLRERSFKDKGNSFPFSKPARTPNHSPNSKTPSYPRPLGDSLSTHSGAHFYTVDHPNQPKVSKPEWIRSGGWWLHHIMTTSLNGLNILSKDKVQTMEGITWLTFGGFQNSLASTEIKVRPKKFKLHGKEKALSDV
ncbi:hypothetical protein AVEN_265074-1 [Araneus ventricosus]|uniref:Fibrinogen C-terminal domain-containing protein n=1 Tax=Araneus ventricosus TaxID=182803 RepID=A0A4Y2PWT4_ARAVE|nr:hypothetical protein AVEN_265074-1 [Araneus ventricosus]